MQVKGLQLEITGLKFLYIIRNWMMIIMLMDVGLFLTSIFIDVTNKALTMANKSNTVTTYKLGH